MTTPFVFDPERPLASEIEDLSDALIVPFDDQRPNRRPKLGGVLRQDGSMVSASNLYISPTRLQNRTPHPESYPSVETRAGTWLFGGKHDGRFGHFLVETLARLWALDHVDAQFDGIVFLPKKVLPSARAQRQFAQTAGVFGFIDGLPKLEVLTTPTRFERLIVPPQGCGAGEMAPGCPEFRAFMRARFGVGIAPEGPKRLYVSRTKMRHTPGHVLFEDIIEDRARRNGYEIFHPQEHDLETQIARYRAADHILGVEGSAFHLIALANPQGHVGFIRRRLGDAPLGFVDQITKTTGNPCVDFDMVTENFVIEGSHPMANAVLDLKRLFDTLVKTGFFSPDQVPDPIGDQQVTAEKARLAADILGRAG